MEYLSSVCLSKGETQAVLVLSGNIPLLKLLLITMVLLVLVEPYLYLWISYYQYFLKVVLHHKRKPLESDCFPLNFFAMLFSFIALILSWLVNDLQITSTAFLLSSISYFPITPLKGAPRLRAQCALKRGRAHAALNRRIG